MNSPLNVLIVEDSEDDTLFILRELRRGGYEVNHARVETPLTMQEALEQQSWDIVISDYTMPTFNALDALKILQSRPLDIPFLIVSGTIGEETAVAAMKAGAQDYLLKGNLARLVPAVERELREAEDRQKRHSAEQALEMSEDRFKTLCASAPLAIFQFDTQGKNVYTNPLWQKISGLSAKESAGDAWLQAIHPEDRQNVTKSWQQTLSQKQSWVSEHRLLTPQGETRWVRTLVRPIYSSQGQFLGHVGTYHREKTTGNAISTGSAAGKLRDNGNWHCPRSQQYLDPYHRNRATAPHEGSKPRRTNQTIIANSE
jgi:PAS domain S-box-containing protein